MVDSGCAISPVAVAVDPMKTYLTPDELSYQIWSLHAELYERTQVKNYPLT